VWFGLLVAALGASVSTPAATTLVTCLPLDAVSASPRVSADEPAAEPCAADGMAAPAFGRAAEITRC
jgi:hypothetical protein